MIFWKTEEDLHTARFIWLELYKGNKTEIVYWISFPWNEDKEPKKSCKTYQKCTYDKFVPAMCFLFFPSSS